MEQGYDTLGLCYFLDDQAFWTDNAKLYSRRLAPAFRHGVSDLDADGISYTLCMEWSKSRRIDS